jgi:hypothetical protein
MQPPTGVWTPRHLFEDTQVVAKAAGALGQRARVLDSTPIYDAVATEDTVTQLRAVIYKLLAPLDQEASPLAVKVRPSRLGERPNGAQGLLDEGESVNSGRVPCELLCARPFRRDRLSRHPVASDRPRGGSAAPTTSMQNQPR